MLKSHVTGALKRSFSRHKHARKLRVSAPEMQLSRSFLSICRWGGMSEHLAIEMSKWLTIQTFRCFPILLVDIFLTKSGLQRIFGSMDTLKELFAYFDSRITELPFYYPKKAFFQEFKDSAANPYLKDQSQKWFTLRLKDYCEEHDIHYNSVKKWDNTQRKNIEYVYLSQ